MKFHISTQIGKTLFPSTYETKTQKTTYYFYSASSIKKHTEQSYDTIIINNKKHNMQIGQNTLSQQMHHSNKKNILAI
jgi:hypothetical protein